MHLSRNIAKFASDWMPNVTPWPPVASGRKRHHWTLSALAILSVYCGLWFLTPGRATCETVEAQVAAHFRAGQEALKLGDLARAVDEFKKVLALDPGLLEAQVNLGLAYHGLGEYKLAVNHLTGAVRQRPDLLGPNIILGIDYLKLGSPARAIPFLRRALELDPTNQEARRALASCYLTQEDYRNAAEQFRQLAVQNPDKAEVWFKLGHDYLDLSARLAFRGARVHRSSAWGRRFLGDMLAQRGRWADAAQEYRQALAIEPKQPGLHVSLGQAYLHGGKLERAEAEFRLELQLDSENEPAWLGLAETQLSKGLATPALESVGRIWEISPEFLALQREFPAIELSSEPARALLTDLQMAPAGAAKYFLLSALHETLGETAQARDQRASFKADFDAWQKADSGPKGKTAPQPCRAHRYAACADLLQSRKPMTVSDRLVLGKTQFTLRQYEPAADTLARLLAVQSNNVEASYWLARSYHARGADCFDRLEESFPNSWRAHQLRGEGYALRESTNDAIREFQLAIQLQVNAAELHEALGELYLMKSSFEEARGELEKSLALDSSRARTLCLLGRLYVRQREEEKAIPYLQKALRHQPDMVEASSLLGTAYVRLGQFASAVPELERAAPFDYYGSVHYQLYLAYRKLGNAERAEKALARSQDLRRSSAESHQAMVSGVADVE
jgi:tetratricopeptide (TPR) repeat protein